MRHDVRLALRFLRSSAGLVAVLVLALALGISTSIHAVVDAILLRPLPFDSPNQLVAILEYDLARPEARREGLTTASSYLGWRHGHAFDSVAAFALRPSVLARPGEAPVAVRTLVATSELFTVLRLTPGLGRLLNPADESPGTEPVVLLSNALWQRRFGGTREAIGARVRLDDGVRVVAGVLPKEFRFPPDGTEAADVVVPAIFRSEDLNGAASGSHQWHVIARLTTGRSVQDAWREVSGAWDGATPSPSTEHAEHSVLVEPLRERVVGDVASAMALLLAGIVAVVAVAFANLGGLMFARAAARAGPWSVMSALGANRWRLVRGLTIEGALLGTVGALAGGVLACMVAPVLFASLPPGMPRATDVALDARVLATLALVSPSLGAIAGMVPAVVASRRSSQELTLAGRAASPQGRLAWQVLTATQVAVAMVVLAAAGLFLTSFRALMSVDVGVDYDKVLAVRVRQAATRTPLTTLDVRRYQDAIAGLPGVTSVAAVQGGIPLSGDMSVVVMTRPGTAFVENVERRVVTPGYLEAMGMSLAAGRWLSTGDASGAAPVVAINETAARRFWPDGNPLGTRVLVGTPASARAVVGVVADTHARGPADDPVPEIYIPAAQSVIVPDTLIVRAAGNAPPTADDVRTRLWGTDPAVEVIRVLPMSVLMGRFVGTARFITLVVMMFAGVGLVVAAIGIYSIVAYAASRRTREVGIRMAVGATPARILRMVLYDAGQMIVVGVVCGTMAALAAGKALRQYLFQVEPTDARILGAAVIVLACAALLAAAAPALRTARIDAVAALRH